MTTKAEVEAIRRLAAGLPVIPCPNCGTVAAHWTPDRLDPDTGLLVAGFYVCEKTA